MKATDAWQPQYKKRVTLKNQFYLNSIRKFILGESKNINTLLLGLSAKIKYSICSYQFNNRYVLYPRTMN